jgi:hypothetical protein
MLYIITYATHSERYFDILKKYPEIIILGWGEKWNGFFDKANAVIEFCKSKNPDDIVCFIDGFDSVILASPDKLLETYKLIGKDLVFSREASYFNVIHKYLLDKVFSRCQNVTVNSGLYIGTCHSIIDFWKNIKKGEDDQVYTNRICKVKNIYVDKEYRLFYNYSSPDKITIKKNELYLFDNIYPTCVISCPGNQDINHILGELGYSDLPKIDYNLYYRVKTYYKHFTFEFYFIIALIVLYFLIQNKIIFFIVCILLIFVLLNYQIYTKHLDLPIHNKIIYTIIDFVHIGIFALLLYVIFHFNCDIFKLLLLNCGYFFILLLFFVLKRSVFVLLENKILNIDEKYGMIGVQDRIQYITDKNYQYQKKVDKNFYDFMEINQIFVFLLFFINLVCIIKIYFFKKIKIVYNKKTDMKGKRKNKS